jgi:hypothetical protein
MDVLRALPPAHLAANVAEYALFAAPIPAGIVAVNGLVAFNPDRCPLVLDGRERPEAALMCVTSDPALLPLVKGAGTIVTVRLVPGAFHRLFGADLTAMIGVHGVDADVFPALARIASRLEGGATDWPGLSAMLNTAFGELNADARPPGAAERFFAMVDAADGNIALDEAGAELGCSRRTLERDCQRRFARAPKRVIRAIRAMRTFARERKGGGRPELHPEFAYADLPHYLRDLRALSGLNRSEHRVHNVAAPEDRVALVWEDGRACEGEAARGAWYANLDRRDRNALLDSLPREL